MCQPLFVGVLCWFLFRNKLLGVLSSFAINLTRKRELVALIYCLVTVNVLWLFLTVLWVGRQFVIVELLDHTHFLGFAIW